MPTPIHWEDADEIALLLLERFPDTDPDVVTDLELAGWVRELPMLSGAVPSPQPRLTACLNAIRSAWRQEWRSER